jgi:hypothetical protein
MEGKEQEEERREREEEEEEERREREEEAEEERREREEKGGPDRPANSKEYSVGEFSEVDASHAVEFEIVPGPEHKVKAVGDGRMIDRLHVEVSGETLRIGLKHGIGIFSRGGFSGNAKVMVTMPKLRKVNVSGACGGSVKGFKSADDFDLGLSGASRAEIDLEAGKTSITISGAGRLSGALNAQRTDITLSGASRCQLTGTGGNTNLTVSGAGHADLSGFSMRDADIELSGASQARIKMEGKLNAELSGASHLEYKGNVTLGRTSTTGASKLRGGGD